ncbi:MAG: hypothetical protein R2697_08935 [Ilumatobacteraceae bacterium]
MLDGVVADDTPPDDDAIRAALREEIAAGATKRDAIATVATRLGLPRSRSTPSPSASNPPPAAKISAERVALSATRTTENRGATRTACHRSRRNEVRRPHLEPPRTRPPRPAQDLGGTSCTSATRTTENRGATAPFPPPISAERVALSATRTTENSPTTSPTISAERVAQRNQNHRNRTANL